MVDWVLTISIIKLNVDYRATRRKGKDGDIGWKSKTQLYLAYKNIYLKHEDINRLNVKE